MLHVSTSYLSNASKRSCFMAISSWLDQNMLPKMQGFYYELRLGSHHIDDQ